MDTQVRTVKMEYLVTEKDFATFNNEVVHQVYSTFSIARDAEWTGRQVFLRNRIDGEEAVGTHVDIKHRAPAFLGEKVCILAELVSFEHGFLICKFKATVGERIIAEGTTGQKVMSKEKIDILFKK